jgi:3-oxoacyl-[acyl-carrier protein] reductase
MQRTERSTPVTRSILITGGSRGIGHAAALAFHAHGDRVAVTYRTKPPAEEHLFAVHCDVTDTASVDTAFTAVEDHQGPVDVVVANAGITHDTLLIRMPEDAFVDVVDTNLVGAYRVAHRAIKNMVRRRTGRMIFVSSAVAFLGEAGQANYAASKAGLVGLARSLAREYGSRTITANVVAPGLTHTDMTADLGTDRIDAMLQRIPLGRAAEPAEIAAAIVFLASDQAAYITGAVVPVDGGVGMGH